MSEATVPVALDWPPATGSQSPVVRYELLMSANYGGYVAIPLPGSLARSVTLELAQQQSHRFVLRAVNAAGNVGAWARTGPLVAGVLHDGDPAIAADVSWSSQAAPQFLRGVTQRSKVGGSVLSVTVTGERVAWLGAKGPNRGSAEVLVDGTLVTTVDTAAAAVQPRQVLFQRRFDVPGTHTLEIRHLDDPVGSRVDVDGFLVVRAGGPDPVLVGAGDIASCDRTTDSATATLLDGVVGTVITTGDLAYDRGTAAEFAACYAPTWGRVKSRTRPTPGNHEYYTTAAAGYFGYFGSAAGAPDKGWYAYDLGTWRIYALNSNCAAVGGCDEGSPQLAWLRADLAARPRACVAAYWHHPRFSSGPHGNNMDVAPLFAELHAAGADVVMTGHDHDYERFALQSPSGEADASTGVRQFVVGTGGNGLYPWGTFKPNSEIRQNTSFGVLELTMRSGAYDWRFLPVAGGMFTDSGTATCH
ncbi:MAG: metallophosphoesterase [Chloroflexi bacterium]|nr:metallophosphoesterase [Chloroflexota bacterium]